MNPGISRNAPHVRAGLDGRTPAELAEAAANYRRVRLGRLSGMVLPVVTPGFTLDDLTPRAASRSLIRHRLDRSLIL